MREGKEREEEKRKREERDGREGGREGEKREREGEEGEGERRNMSGISSRDRVQEIHSILQNQTRRALLWRAADAMKASCLSAQVGGHLEGVSEELEAGNLGARELGSLGDAGLEVGDLSDELHGALAGDEVVLHHAAESDHAKAAVLDLNNGAAVGLEAKGVEAIVAGAVELAVEGLLDEGDLEREEEGEHLLGGSDLDELVVKRPHLLAGVPLAVEGEGEKVLDDQSGGSEHGNAAVLDLSLAGPDHVGPAEDAAVLSPVRGLDVVAARGLVREAVLHGGAASDGSARGGRLGQHAAGGEGRSRGGAGGKEQCAVHGGRDNAVQGSRYFF